MQWCGNASYGKIRIRRILRVFPRNFEKLWIKILNIYIYIYIFDFMKMELRSFVAIFPLLNTGNIEQKHGLLPISQFHSTSLQCNCNVGQNWNLIFSYNLFYHYTKNLFGV